MLLGNYSVLNRNPLRYLGGGMATPECNHHGALLRGGARKNRQYVERTSAANSQFSLPYGSYQYYALLIPQKGGDLSARRSSDFSVSGLAAGGLGMPGFGSASFSVTTNVPNGELIVSGSGSASFIVSANDSLLAASINGNGSITFVVATNAPILGAEASLVGETTITISTNTPGMLPIDTTSPLRTASAAFAFSGELVRYAVGNMAGTTDVSDVVTNASLARAVWDSVLAEFTNNGSAGKALSTASAGGVDLEAMAAAILTAAQADPIHANVQKMNDVDVVGNGTAGNKWRGA